MTSKPLRPTAEEKAALLRTVTQSQAAESRARRTLQSRQQASLVSVARALSGGVPANELAELLGVTRQRVYQMRDEALAPHAPGDGCKAP